MASGFSPGSVNEHIPPDPSTKQNWTNSDGEVSKTVDGSFAARRLPEWMDPINGELSILVMTPAQEKGTFPDNPWVIRKTIENSVGDIEDARPEARGTRYILKVRQARQVKKLLSVSELIDGTKVKIDYHQTLNVRKCTVSCPYGLSMSDDELTTELRSQRVVEVKRFMRKDPKNKDKLLPTPTCLISVQGTTLPEFFYFGYARVRTRPYYPSPLQCGKCHRFAHTKRNCQETPICPECSLEHEVKLPCLAEAHCVNCKGPHSARARVCPVKMAEAKIVRIKVDEDVSFPEARKRYDSRQKDPCIQERLESPKVAELLRKLESKDEEIGKLRNLLEKLIAEVAELKKDKTANLNKNTRKDTKKETSNIEIAENLDRSPSMETDDLQDIKGTKRRQSTSNPSSPNGKSPPLKKHVENGKDLTNTNSPVTSRSTTLEFSRTDISPPRDIAAKHA